MGAKRVGDPSVYEAADLIREKCWLEDGSAFTPGETVWTRESFEELTRDFVENPATSAKHFDEKLHEQIGNSSDEAIQLMAELMYLHLLVTVTTTKETKQKLIATVLGFMRTPVELPDELVPALGHGLVNPGTYFNTGRWAQLGFLIELGIKFKGLGSAERSEVMGDPWAFRDMAYSITGQGPASQRHALLHLFFPQDFEAIVSDDHIGRIIDRFRDHTSGKTDDPARQIQEIRDALTPRYGEGFDFYDIRLRPLWQDQEDPWPELVGWARKLIESPPFDEEERTYKLEAVGLLADAPDAVRSNDEWQERVIKGVMNSKNNLTPWQVNDSFKKWIEADPDDARLALVALWDSEDGPGRRVQAFSDRCPSSISSPGQKVALASYLLMGTDPENLPVYRPDPFKKVYELVGTSMYAKTEGERYEEALRFCDALMSESSHRGLELRDRLDAQAVVWAITKSDKDSTILQSWPREDRDAFFQWRDGEKPDPGTKTAPGSSPGSGSGPSDLGVVAERCHLPVDYLEQIVDLLHDKRQVVFYGPPGTGKTFVAQELAAHLAGGSSERAILVQFHPSTSYEDFFEGIRPRTDDEGRLHYELRPGPLARVAEKARSNPDETYVVVIDEFNRANLPKVLGELLFLLEYRDREIRTLYRPDEPFSLPENLLFIATMNTVDRSVALVDAAMRRRFHFVPFYPDREPISEVLASVCADDEQWIAALVSAVNVELREDLGSRDHQLGASHFIQTLRTEEGIQQVWEHTIEPLIEDQMFGHEEGLEKYRWESVRHRHASIVGQTEPDALGTDVDTPDGSTP